MVTFLILSGESFSANLRKREYRNFPANPTISFLFDPQETLISTFEGVREDEVCDKYLRKWTRRLEKGKITVEQWDKAYSAWGSGTT